MLLVLSFGCICYYDVCFDMVIGVDVCGLFGCLLLVWLLVVSLWFLLAWTIVSGCDLVCFVCLTVAACCCVGVLSFGFAKLGCGEF